RIAPHHHPRAALPRPAAEPPCVTRHECRGKIAAHDPADAGHAHHEGSGHGGNVETRRGRVNRTRRGPAGAAAARRARSPAGGSRRGTPRGTPPPPARRTAPPSPPRARRAPAPPTAPADRAGGSSWRRT